MTINQNFGKETEGSKIYILGSSFLTMSKGRPKVDDPRTNVYFLHLNTKEMRELEDLSCRLGMCKADVIREALRYFAEKESQNG